MGFGPFHKGLYVLPRWCKCGNLVKLINETRCEECFADDAQRYSGRPSRIDTIGKHGEQSEIRSPLSRRTLNDDAPTAT
jgi:hypothetical protein